MSQMGHPHVVLYMGVCTAVPGKLMIVTELLGKDLNTLLIEKVSKSVPLDDRRELKCKQHCCSG